MPPTVPKSRTVEGHQFIELGRVAAARNYPETGFGEIDRSIPRSRLLARGITIFGEERLVRASPDLRDHRIPVSKSDDDDKTQSLAGGEEQARVPFIFVVKPGLRNA